MAPAHVLMTRLMLGIVNQLSGVVGNVHYQCSGKFTVLVCSRKVMSNARPDQLITFTRSRHEALPIDDRDLLTAALNQPRTLPALRQRS